MNLELAVLEMHVGNGDAGNEEYVCEIQLDTSQVRTKVPTEEAVKIPVSVDMLNQQVSLTLKTATDTVIGQTKILLRDLVNCSEARWYPLKASTNKKLIQRSSVASMKLYARVNSKKKTHQRALSSLPPQSSLRDIRIPKCLTPASDNPNPSPVRPLSACPSPTSSSPDHSIPLEIEQALIGVNEKVQTFHRIDAEMGKIRRQVTGVIGTGESFEGDIPPVQLDMIEDHTPKEDKLGQEIKKTLGYIRSRAGSPQSPFYTELEDLRHDLISLNQLQKEQEIQIQREQAVSLQEKEAFGKEKEAMARMISKLNHDLKAAEAEIRAKNRELRLLQGDKLMEKMENTAKMQENRLIPEAIPDYTDIFNAQREQHRELSEKYEKMFQECAKHRKLLTELEEKNGNLVREVEFLREKETEKQGEIEGLKRTSRFLEEENRKLKAVGQAAAARVNEITELTKDVHVLSDLSVLHSEKALAAHIVIAKLLALLEEKEADLRKYRRVMLPKYRVEEGDETDVALGKYLEENLVQVPFVREEQGVYRFGTKRVFIRLEQGNIIIRVGGGYMHLDEFVDIYTPLEMVKLRERPEDPVRQALVQRLQEQLDTQFQPCLGVSKVPERR